jgi:Fe2+ transport system protein FeoA
MTDSEETRPGGEGVVPLGRLRPKERGIIVKVGGRGPVHRRILDMGVVPGTQVEVVKVAPLGDPVELLIRGYHLSLRKEEAREVFVERM